MVYPLFFSHLKENINSQIKLLIFFGGFTHVGYFILGIIFGIWPVAVYSAVAAVAFFCFSVFIKISNFIIFYILTFIEIVASVTWLEFSVGTSLGFPLYFFVLIPVSIYILYTEHSQRFRFIFLGCAFIFNILGYLFFFQILSFFLPETDISFPALLTFLTFNTICVSFMIGFLSLYFMLHMQTQFSIIEKENSVLSEMSFRDELTGLYNRRFMKDFLEKEFGLKKEFCVAMSDLDFFKQFNDRFGHEAGDLILKTLATLLLPFSEKHEISVCRWGGEEFLFYFAVPPQDAAQTLNQIRENIEKSVLSYKDKLLHITMTFGISDSSRNYDSLSKMIEAADNRLYRGKKEGRNRVVL